MRIERKRLYRDDKETFSNLQDTAIYRFMKNRYQRILSVRFIIYRASYIREFARKLNKYFFIAYAYSVEALC